jgi:hypothetical protein
LHRIFCLPIPVLQFEIRPNNCLLHTLGANPSLKKHTPDNPILMQKIF